MSIYSLTPDCPYMQDGWQEAVWELKEEAPQLFMQQRLEALMYEIAKYMLSVYDLYEE